MTGRKNCALQVPLVVPYKALEKFSKVLYGTMGDTCSAQFFCPVIGSLKHCIHYRLTMLVSWDCMRSLSPVAIICIDLWDQWHLSISYILEHLACFGRDGQTQWWCWQWYTKRGVEHFCITIYYKRMCKQECLHLERKVQRKWRHRKLWMWE